MVCWPDPRRQQSLTPSTPSTLVHLNTGLGLTTGSLICHRNSWKIIRRESLMMAWFHFWIMIHSRCSALSLVQYPTHSDLFTAQRRECTHFRTGQVSRWRAGQLGRATPPGAPDSPPGRTASLRMMRTSKRSRTVSRSCLLSIMSHFFSKYFITTQTPTCHGNNGSAQNT